MAAAQLLGRQGHARDEVWDSVLALLPHAELLLCKNLGDRRVARRINLGREATVPRVVRDDEVRPSGSEGLQKLRAKQHALHRDAVAHQQRRGAGVAVCLIRQLNVGRLAGGLVVGIDCEPLGPDFRGGHSTVSDWCVSLRSGEAGQHGVLLELLGPAPLPLPINQYPACRLSHFPDFPRSVFRILRGLPLRHKPSSLAPAGAAGKRSRSHHWHHGQSSRARGSPSRDAFVLLLYRDQTQNLFTNVLEPYRCCDVLGCRRPPAGHAAERAAGKRTTPARGPAARTGSLSLRRRATRARVGRSGRKNASGVRLQLAGKMQAERPSLAGRERAAHAGMGVSRTARGTPDGAPSGENTKSSRRNTMALSTVLALPADSNKRAAADTVGQPGEC